MRKNGKRMVTKIVAVVLTLVVALGTAFAAPAENVEAAVTAKSLVKSALEYMESYDVISYTYDLSLNLDGKIRTRTGMGTSDLKISHGFNLDSGESEGGWESYSVKGTVYRKAYNSSSWKVNTKSDYDRKSVDSYTAKKYAEYMLGHLKNMKIASKGKTTYTITANPDYTTDVKNVTLIIDKEEKCITKIKYTYKKYTGTYLNTTRTYTVKNKVETYSNICYGEGTLKLPSGL